MSGDIGRLRMPAKSLTPVSKPPRPPRTRPKGKGPPEGDSLDCSATTKRFPGPEDRPRTLSLNLPVPERTTALAKLVCEKKLPVCISLTAPIMVPGCSTNLEKGEVLMLHFIYDNPTVHATMATGKKLRLPVYAKEEYEILPLNPDLDNVEYDTTEKLINADPRPDRVRVVEAHCSCHPDEAQEVDDVIDIQGIDYDEERGKVIVGMCEGGIIKFSADMYTSRYTTMVSPNLHRLSELKEEKFPQRVRKPEWNKSFSERDPKREKVLHLSGFTQDKHIVATRAGHSHVYTIPVNAPLQFRVRDMSELEADLPGLLPPLYALVNTTWGLVDPTQEELSQRMELIPQPMSVILEAWLDSVEGKDKASEVADIRKHDLLEQVMEANKEMRRMKVEMEFWKELNAKRDSVTSLNGSTPSPPPRTPRGTEKPPEIPVRPSVRSPVTPPAGPCNKSFSSALSKDSHTGDDTYDTLEEAVSGPQDVMSSVKQILGKKERELTEAKRLVELWKGKFEDLQKENNVLKQKTNTPAFYEELPDIPATKRPLPAPPTATAATAATTATTATTYAAVDENYNEYLRPSTVVGLSSTLPMPRTKTLRSKSLTEERMLGAAYRQTAPSSRPLQDYTEAEVGALLRELGMPQYVRIFHENQVNGALLVRMDEHVLKDLSMSPLHALKLKVHITKRAESKP